MAQKWAEHLAEKDEFKHSERDTRQGVGENLAAMRPLPANPGEYITSMWYDEIKNYDFDNPGFNGNTGHFTQVVWKSSTELGVGMAKNQGGMYIFVANYEPAGNVLGSFPQNVLPPSQ